ncbi:hypothetical protein [Noviherbaspirillum sp.]|uniref:type III secretion apparatus assembly protein SctX n=1 Tax=Noviherbaspirillum sp. TaxID=1926288 RepID=UPI002B484CD5|nr:hypothetical protein [Noviherbaspirillum sp.]HJV80579.1 hypothetical protein [Noviherbaspirillum sp.]
MALSPVKNSPGTDLDSIFSERGVEGMLPGPEHDFRLPDINLLQPAEVVIASQIDRMLGRSNIEDIVLTAIQPRVLNRLLLRPERFNAAVAALGHSLEALCHSHDGRESIAPQLAARAHAVLQEEIGLRKLLDSFRNALLQA